MTVKFKNPDTGDIIEVDETFAEQVLRPQNHYEEILDEKPKSTRTRKLRIQGQSGESEKK